MKRWLLIVMLCPTALMASWDKTLPADSSLWNLAAGYIRDNWSALQDGTATVNYPTVHNVEVYGAIANDDTDDSTAFTAAITAAAIGDIIYIPQGEYDVHDISISKLGLTFRGAGMSTVVASGSGTTSGGTIIQCSQVDSSIFEMATSDSTWSIQASFEDLALKAYGSWPFTTPDGNAVTMGNSSINEGRFSFRRVCFVGFEKAVEKLDGNIGNTFEECVFQTCDYAMYALADTGGSMHAGNDYYTNKCHFGAMKKAVFYYDSDSSTGGIFVDNCIIEANPGFVFFIKAFHSGQMPSIVVKDTHFESNSNFGSTDIVVDSNTYTASGTGSTTIVFGKFHNAPDIIFENCHVSEMTLTTDSLVYPTTVYLKHCSGDTSYAANVDDDSAIIWDEYQSEPFETPPISKISNAYSGDILLSETFENIVTFTTGGDVTTTSTGEGTLFPVCQSLTMGAQYKTYGDVSISAGSWVVCQLTAKWVSGTAYVPLQIRNAGGTFTTTLVSYPSSEWATYTTIVPEADAESNVGLRVTGTADATVIQFGGLQIVEFATAQEAYDFQRSNVFAITAPRSEIILLSETTVSFAADADTVLYTVPTGYRCMLDHLKVVAGADAGATTTLSVGANGAETDFVPNNTLSNLDAQYDMVIIRPVPNTTPLKSKSYAASTVIDARVGSNSGGATNTVYLYGTLY